MLVLKDIGNENWIKCVMLNPSKHEQVAVVNKFVDSVAYSMVWAQMKKKLITKAIYDNEEIIGFTMYGFCEEVEDFKIYNILIDEKHQGKGYGRKVVSMILEEIKKMPNVKNVYLTFHPENIKAKTLYESFGFKNTGLKFRLPEEVIKDIYGENYTEENDDFLYCLQL